MNEVQRTLIEKLEYLQIEHAKCSSGAKKFELKHAINACKLELSKYAPSTQLPTIQNQQTMSSSKTIKTLVIVFLDLENTTTMIEEFQNLLKLADNKKITLVPITMETCNQIYYRNLRLVDTVERSSSCTGCRYRGLTDDKRAIRSFIGDCFNFIKPTLSGRKTIHIVRGSSYEKEANMLKALISGQQLDSKVKIGEKYEK